MNRKLRFALATIGCLVAIQQEGIAQEVIKSHSELTRRFSERLENISNDAVSEREHDYSLLLDRLLASEEREAMLRAELNRRKESSRPEMPPPSKPHVPLTPGVLLRYELNCSCGGRGELHMDRRGRFHAIEWHGRKRTRTPVEVTSRPSAGAMWIDVLADGSTGIYSNDGHLELVFGDVQ